MTMMMMMKPCRKRSVSGRRLAPLVTG